ncbi:ATP-grasp domain-containing protein [Cytobacillus gottheilii]|uniref:ATP-grasp domain-containing protein n=1 Tax=Cytobacillus gottheilii TaxID=859144 RepID=UPI0009B93879
MINRNTTGFKSPSNVLITSISRKVPLLQSIKAAMAKIDLNMKLYGGDNDRSVIGKHFVDTFWEMPIISNLDIEELISYCKKNEIRFIIPTRDGELKYFSLNRERLKRLGIHIMISPLFNIEICLDKFNFFSYSRENGIPVIPTFLCIEDSRESMKYVVKERFGAGSQTLGKSLTSTQALNHAKNLKEPIFQPMIEGTEYSIDIYVDINGRSKGVISRTRDKIVDGESQITTIRNIPELEKLCSAAAEKLGLYGHVIFQVIIDQNNEFHIIECNPRFGGASTLSVAAGLDSFYWFFLESMGVNLDQYSFIQNEKVSTMVRHPQDYIY